MKVFPEPLLTGPAARLAQIQDLMSEHVVYDEDTGERIVLPAILTPEQGRALLEIACESEEQKK